MKNSTHVMALVDLSVIDNSKGVIRHDSKRQYSGSEALQLNGKVNHVLCCDVVYGNVKLMLKATILHDFSLYFILNLRVI